MIMRAIALASLALLPFFAYAEEAEHAVEGAAHEAAAGHEAAHAAASHGAHGGIPQAVTFQFINFAIYALILIFVLRKPIKSYFKAREEHYKQALIRAESARKDAESKKREIQERLNKLEDTSKQSVESARAEAQTLKQQIRQQAEELSQRLKTEATRTASLELERAKTELRMEMLNQSVAMSRKLLEEKMAEPDQKRLQSEFVSKIREVHQ